MLGVAIMIWEAEVSLTAHGCDDHHVADCSVIEDSHFMMGCAQAQPRYTAGLLHRAAVAVAALPIG